MYMIATLETTRCFQSIVSKVKFTPRKDKIKGYSFMMP